MNYDVDLVKPNAPRYHIWTTAIVPRSDVCINLTVREPEVTSDLYKLQCAMPLMSIINPCKKSESNTADWRIYIDSLSENCDFKANDR